MKLVGRYQVTILIFFESHSFFDDSQTVLEWIFVKISTSSVNRHEVANILSVVNIASNAFRFRFRLSGVIFVQTPTKNVSHVCQWDKHKVNCILEPPERNVSTELNLYLNFFHWNISFLAEHEHSEHILPTQWPTMGAVAKNANDKKMRLTIDRSTNRQRDTNTVLAFSECEYFPPCQTRNVNCFLSFFAPEKKRNRPHFVANRTSCMWPAEASE